MGNEENIAYFSERKATHQCDLSFSLSLKKDVFGIQINEEFHALRKTTDCVSSLLQHVVNKVVKILKDKGCEISEPNIPVSLSYASNERICKGGTCLYTFFEKCENLIFKILDQRYHVIVNAPVICGVQLPEILYVNCSIEPVKFKASHITNNLTKYYWYRSKDKQNWTKVGNKFSYLVSEDDVSHYLKVVVFPRNERCSGQTVEAISSSVVQQLEDIPVCPFELRHEHTKENLEGDMLRLVSYNILSKRYSETNEQFPYCPPKILSIHYRKQLIVKELLGYKGDIICLQEVDHNEYTNYFKEKFKSFGYTTIFHKKGNRIPEGLACVFNRSRFKLLKCQQIVFSMEIQRNKLFSHLWNAVKKKTEIKNIFMRQPTSLQVTFLKDKKTKTHIIVANTHLFYHPDATVIRLIQINMATTFLNFLKNKEIKEGHEVAVIFCGDFNSSPTSPIIQYMLEGGADEYYQELFKIGQKGSTLYHSMCFQSACGFPKYTNYTGDFKECLDYIFIERCKFSVEKCIPMPTEEELSAYQGLPNEVYPSDHIALVVDVKLCAKLQ